MSSAEAAACRRRAAQALPHPALRHLATAGGIGTLVPKGAGTLASCAACLPWWWLPAEHAQLGFFALALAATAGSVVASRALPADADPGWFVLDEFAGQWLTLALLGTLNALGLALALIAFRAFDIWKPFPIRRLERAPWGFGIVLDDLLAGAYAAGLVALVLALV